MTGLRGGWAGRGEENEGNPARLVAEGEIQYGIRSGRTDLRFSHIK